MFFGTENKKISFFEWSLKGFRRDDGGLFLFILTFYNKSL